MDEVVLVDTDVLIDLGRKVAEAVACLAQIEQHVSPAVSAVTHMELMVGCRNKTELRTLDRFLARFQVALSLKSSLIAPSNCSAGIGSATGCSSPMR